MTDVKQLKILQYPDAIPTIPSFKGQALRADETSAFWSDVSGPALTGGVVDFHAKTQQL